MENKNDLPKRKATRLKNYDYSSRGAYFVTICTKDRKQLLSEIIKIDFPCKDTTKPVGEGLAPPEHAVKLKPCGAIAREQLLLIEERYSNVSIEDFVIMPDHIHAILFLENTGGASCIVW